MTLESFLDYRPVFDNIQRKETINVCALLYLLGNPKIIVCCLWLGFNIVELRMNFLSYKI